MADIFQIIENNGTPKSIEDRKARTNIAPYFEASNANAAGDLVLSDTGVLYRFNTAYTAGTSWSSRTSKEQVNLAKIKAPLDSPAFTGIPTAPTAAAGTSNTQIATTAYADTSSSNAIIPINSSINAIDSSLAIVSDGDTHIALTTGQYIYVKNHNTLAEGLYTANSAIGANVTLTTSNVTEVTVGGLNKLDAKIDAHDFIKTITVTGTTDSNGFLNTSIAWADYVILGAKDLYINNTILNDPYSIRALIRGSSASSNKYSVQFLAWDNVILGKSSSMSVKITYMPR